MKYPFLFTLLFIGLNLSSQVPGMLDISFDVDDKSLIAFHSPKDFLFDVELQSDGRIIIGLQSEMDADNKSIARIRRLFHL